MLTLFEISSWLNISCQKNIEITGICIDSRQVKPGNLFVAIQGERFDGHDFVEEALVHGAVAVVCDHAMPDVEIEQLVVPDPIQALAAMATHYRQKLSCAVIAVTGSNGKTTVKEMIAAILPKPAHATPGNLNNHIGVPLSVLRLQVEHRYAVFELGANHPGEIAHGVSMVQPQVTLINNIAPAHMEGFGTIEGVAHAKGEIHRGLSEHGTAIINEDDVYAHFWDSLLIHKKILRFSALKPADVYARHISFNTQAQAQFNLVMPQGEVLIQLKVPGKHNVCNALAAAACAEAVGVDLSTIASGLRQFSGVSGRMTFRVGKNHSLVIDDTYNANLRSVLVALEVLAGYKGRRVFVFGDMGELGALAKEHHQEVGMAARSLGIETVMTCGAHSRLTANAFGRMATHHSTQEALLKDLLNQLDENTTVLVKGSRAASMEKIVHQLVR